MKLGVFQDACGDLGFESRLARLDTTLEGQTLDLVVCPELFVTGCHIDADHRDLAAPAEGRFFQGIAPPGPTARHRHCLWPPRGGRPNLQRRRSCRAGRRAFGQPSQGPRFARQL